MKPYIDILKNKGLKITPRRKAIIDIFVNCHKHLTSEGVWSLLSNEFDKCGLPSVYRNLETLVECGILTRIQQFDRKKHYGLCTEHHNHPHHHITCISCGKVEELGACEMDNKRIIKGYKVVNHFMQVNGICAGCSK